jgi:hypothetical protein
MTSSDAVYEHGNGPSNPTKAENFLTMLVAVDFECLILICTRDGYWKRLQTEVQVSSRIEYVTLVVHIVNNISSM